MIDKPRPKPLVWIASSRRDFMEFPDAVKSEMGYAMFLAQCGGRHRKAKSLKGAGDARVVEIVDDHRGGTFRTVYTVRFASAVYMLHAFQKKSKTGIATPKTDLRLIEQRLGLRRGAYTRSKTMTRRIGHEKSSGNVFADIGLPNAEEHLVKAKLVMKIDALMRARGLKQAEAARLFGVKQPDVSKMLRGDFRQFSVERLMRFLVALGQDVEIVVKPHRGKAAPALDVA